MPVVFCLSLALNLHTFLHTRQAFAENMAWSCHVVLALYTCAILAWKFVEIIIATLFGGLFWSRLILAGSLNMCRLLNNHLGSAGRDAIRPEINYASLLQSIQMHMLTVPLICVF